MPGLYPYHGLGKKNLLFLLLYFPLPCFLCTFDHFYLKWASLCLRRTHQLKSINLISIDVTVIDLTTRPNHRPCFFPEPLNIFRLCSPDFIFHLMIYVFCPTSCLTLFVLSCRAAWGEDGNGAVAFSRPNQEGGRDLSTGQILQRPFSLFLHHPALTSGASFRGICIKDFVQSFSCLFYLLRLSRLCTCGFAPV